MKIAILIILYCFSCSAFAETYKCVQSGKTTYSSLPCGDNAQITESHVSLPGGYANSVSLERDATGVFSMPGSVNGQQTTFTVDTVSTFTTISGDFAYKLGIHNCTAAGVSHTANGDTPFCRVTVSSLSVGRFNFSNITIYLNPTMRGNFLLGNDLLSGFTVNQKANLMVISK
jgi:clan AA aspartic protease (TIGR02281 family)